MATPEQTAAVLVNNPEVVNKLQVRVRPTKQKIDAPQDTNTPVVKRTLREGNHYRIEDAVRFSVDQISPIGVSLTLEIICQETFSKYRLFPLYVDEKYVIHFGCYQAKIDRVRPKSGKAISYFSLDRQIRIIEEDKESLKTLSNLNGQEGTL